MQKKTIGIKYHLIQRFVYITNMSYSSCECKSLSSLPDISNWDTSNAIKMNYMFCECRSLSSLPDISK